VDFEQGLNNAMKRLRAALEDNAETPQFIETLPRRGIVSPAIAKLIRCDGRNLV
jgi:DNA-binding winged helix-turn-helix (wHTH) protein